VPSDAVVWPVQVWRAVGAARFLRVALLLGLCLLFQAVDWFWIIAVVGNTELVLPGLWCNPDVVGWRGWAATQAAAG
jgi:hypothetical protein